DCQWRGGPRRYASARPSHAAQVARHCTEKPLAKSTSRPQQNQHVLSAWYCSQKQMYLRSMLWSGSNYGGSMKRAVLYLRVSTTDQTTANQERELREVASRMGCEIVRVYKDHGISGAKARDKRPEFDRLLRDAAQRKFDMVMAWSVDRLGRSL